MKITKPWNASLKLTAEKGTVATRHEKIFVAGSADNLGLGYMEKVMELIEVARNNGGRCEIIGMLKELVPTFEWDGEVGSRIPPTS